MIDHSKQVVFKTHNHHQIIEIERSPFASGGEGDVYRILKPSVWEGDFCVKLYHPHFRTQQHEEKIKYMMAHQPEKIREKNYLICWPDGLVYENDMFLGFRMPLAFPDSELLYELCLPTLKTKLSEEWRMFERHTKEGAIVRAKLCQRIAVPIYRIHQLRHYVFVDLKPQNILVNPQGKISLIDLDSIQICNNTAISHNGRVMTPDYMPPESDKLKPHEGSIPRSWDYFSMAVIFYQILIGLHPFATPCTQGCGESERECNGIYEKVRCGVSVCGSNPHYINKNTMPHLHQHFEKTLPQSIQELFIKAFNAGHHDAAQRPDAAEWGNTFHRELQNAPSGFSPQERPDSASSDLVLVQDDEHDFIEHKITTISDVPIIISSSSASFWDNVKSAILRFFDFF